MDETLSTETGAAEAGAETTTPTLSKAAELFETAKGKLFSGHFDQLSPEEWTTLAWQYSMRIALALIILFLAMTIAGWVAMTVRVSLARLKFDPTLSKFLSKLARWMVLLLAGLCCLSYFGVETTSFAAVIGAAGLAIGLAFQGTLSNFAAGAMLLVFRPFKVGDVVNISDQLGKVDEISLFTTSIDTFDNRRIILPNSAVFGANIENITYHPVRRADVDVGAAYDADIDATRAALERAIAETPGALTDPEPAVVLQGLGASSVDWSVRVWARGDDFLGVKQALIRSVKNSLDSAGIGIPFPQMDVHLQQQD